MKKTDEKVLQDVFDVIVEHFEFMNECRCDLSSKDFKRYLIGARYALTIALHLDFESNVFVGDFFNKKLDEYFGGQ